MANGPGNSDDKQYDVFISHASEDKDFVDPLASALIAAGLRVWYDSLELKIGDSLSGSINRGLSQSRFGVVVISQAFFRKRWPQHEMSGLVALQMSGQSVMLPIWHRITKDEIMQHAPPLADIVAMNSSTQGVEDIVKEIVKLVRGDILPPQDYLASPTTTPSTGPNFAVVYVAISNTSELPREAEPEKQAFRTTYPPTGWLSVVSGDEELEYVLEEKKLRLRINYGNRWDGDEFWAHQMMSGGEHFAIVIRRSDGPQLYFPTVVNTSPSSWLGSTNRSGWMVFEIQS